MTGDGYEVVHGEFFAHTNEPSLTFYKNRVYVNMVCLNLWPETTCIQFLIHPQKKKLLLRKSLPEDKDALRWCSAGSGKRRPRQIPCPAFSAKLFSLLGWDPVLRYRLLGKQVTDGADVLLAFDLNAPECYAPGPPGQTPRYPASWESQFGVPAARHQNLPVQTFEENTVLTLTEGLHRGKEPHEQTDKTDTV